MPPFSRLRPAVALVRFALSAAERRRANAAPEAQSARDERLERYRAGRNVWSSQWPPLIAGLLTAAIVVGVLLLSH